MTRIIGKAAETIDGTLVLPAWLREVRTPIHARMAVQLPVPDVAMSATVKRKTGVDVAVPLPVVSMAIEVVGVRPLAAWSLDEESGTTAADAIGSLDGTHGAAVTVDADGVVGRAASYDRSGGDPATDLGADTALSFERTDMFSVALWVRTTTTEEFTRVMANGYEEEEHWLVALNRMPQSPASLGSFGLSMGFGDGDFAIVVQSSGVTVNDGEWHHLAITYDGTSQASGVALYFDGQLVGVVVLHDSLSEGSLVAAGKRAVIGGTDNSEGSSACRFTGDLDDVAVFRRELTASDIQRIYLAGLMGVSVAEWWSAPVPHAKCLDFDGTNDHVDMGNVSALSFERTSPFSLSFWAKWTTTNSVMFVAKMLDDSLFRGYVVGCDGSTGNLFVILRSTLTNRIDRRYAPPSSLRDGAWHHILVCYTGSSLASGVKMVVDGVNVTGSLTTTADNLTTTMMATAPFQLGARSSFEGAGSNDWFQGQLDEVAVYNADVSAHAADIYNSGEPPDLRTVGGASDLVAYWPLGDLDTYPTVRDIASTTPINGTMTNMSEGDIVDDAP